MSAETMRRVLIVGGVAGGASCAARLRRLDERADIHIFERGPHVSFANCGLPYYIGDVIPREEDLLVAGPQIFEKRFRIHVHANTEAVAIDRAAGELRVRDLTTGGERSERFDHLVLSPGASPIRPPLPGIDRPGIFTLRNIPDSVTIREWIAGRRAKSAVIVGGGFIGLEMAENLARRGLEVTVVEMLNQVMPPFDPEMAEYVAAELRAQGVRLALGDGVAAFEEGPGGNILVKTASGAEYAGDMVVLSIGVRPDTALAKAAGLELGPRGGIKTDDQMRTSDPRIFAIGDAVEVRDWVTGAPVLIPLAGPANRQGRIAADALCGRDSKFRGTQGTAICGIFELQAAATGASEKALRRAEFTDFETLALHPNNHAGYYPGAEKIHMKIIFRTSDGLLLGAQAVGRAGVDRRIDVIAALIQKHGTVFDLEESELCYAPQFGTAKDAINFAGMAAANVLRGDVALAHWHEPAQEGTLFLDVRSPEEFAGGHVAGALNIPLETLRDRLTEIPAGADIRAYCAVGIRGYLATRVLFQNGIPARNLSGGFHSAPAKMRA